MAFAKFMAGPIGRGIRILAGLAIIAYGITSIPGIGGIIVAIIGVLPVLAGALNFCMIAPIIGAPFTGKQALNS